MENIIFELNQLVTDFNIQSVIEHSEYKEGVVRGLEIALKILEDANDTVKHS